MASFDVVSEVNMQEVENAVNQTRKEVESRYDFKGSQARVEWDKKEITLTAEDEYKVKAMKDILLSKMHKRGVDIMAAKAGDIEKIGGFLLRIKVTLVQGIEKEIAKKIVGFIKDTKIKAQAQIMDDKVRVTSKSIDSLQDCISRLRQQKFGIPLQFHNMRS